MAIRCVLASERPISLADLAFTLDSPNGATDPTVKEDVGSSVSVNTAVRIRVWKLHVTDPGVYTVHTDGNVSASARMVWAARSSGRTLARAPAYRPIGVRTPVTR